VLYFVSEGAAINPYGNEAVYELESAVGLQMAVGSGAPTGLSLGEYWQRGDWEQNKTFPSGLLDAPELWLWNAVISPATKSYPFTLSGLVS
jgi:hypothetical protein